MSVKTAITEKDGIYFITFTCQGWLPLFELTNAYDTVYKWFDYLKSNGHFILGYVLAQSCTCAYWFQGHRH